ncbi:hypothetical protein LEP1GSC202_0322 [Leptospira yanagawae serovar Saopaulo str. Sao Paulo = ATCC 700523]|uniref:Uncharacterized protein n=1 Tax=Leptospira yanagawae serovar Saopaulo str. Sao Paulo = ATCC 700523 TaxID=1249483 RepID=A0A5E8HCN7_9LEPT|nr:hypothetical protein [Leptospira yanagawae]EOQ88537.1 hypothetical protein LEP1GSC202_0322 [Leptospira yanagawae serovar Saopaulo str. Sao Paulo = ATCC 700523]
MLKELRYLLFFLISINCSKPIENNDKAYSGFKEVPFIHEHWTKHDFALLKNKTEIFEHLEDKIPIDFCPKDTISRIEKFSSFFYSNKYQQIRLDRILITCGAVSGWVNLKSGNLILGNEKVLKNIIGNTLSIDRFKSRMTGITTISYFRISMTPEQSVYFGFKDSKRTIKEIFPIFYERNENEWILENENTKLQIEKNLKYYKFKVLKDKHKIFNFLNNKEFILELDEI